MGTKSLKSRQGQGASFDKKSFFYLKQKTIGFNSGSLGTAFFINKKLKKSRSFGERRGFMKKTELKLVIDNQPAAKKAKKKDLKKQFKKMQCRAFRQALRTARGREEYLDGII